MTDRAHLFDALPAPGALRALVESYDRPMRSDANRMLRMFGLAEDCFEDLMQEAAEEIVASIERITDANPDQKSTFLMIRYRAAMRRYAERNVSIVDGLGKAFKNGVSAARVAHLRRAKIHDLDEADLALAAVLPMADDEAGIAEVLERVAWKLSPAHLSVLQGVIAGYSLTDIGALLGLDPGATRRAFLAVVGALAKVAGADAQHATLTSDYSRSAAVGFRGEPRRMVSRRHDAAAYIEERVRRDGEHWMWIGAVSNGWPKVSLRLDGAYHGFGARALVWEVHRGKIPAGDKIIADCGRALCVNPDHLRLRPLADPGETVADRRRAEQRGRADAKRQALDDLAEQVRVLKAQGLTFTAIEKRTGITRSRAHWLMRRDTATYLKLPDVGRKDSETP